MKKLNLLLFIVFLSFNVFSQIKTYTYQRYGVVESPSNSLGLSDSELEITKFNNRFTISSTNNNGTHSFELNVALKGYNEFEEEYVYIGDATHIVRYNGKESKSVGKCLIVSHYKLDYYLENKGKDPNDIKFFSSWNKELSFIVYFNKMKYSMKAFDTTIERYEEDSYIRIFPIRNKTEKEKQQEILKEKQTQKQKEDNIDYIENLLSEVNIEEEMKQLGIKLKEHCKKILMDTIANYNLTKILFYNTNIQIYGNFVFHIDENRKITEIKRDISYSNQNSNYYDDLNRMFNNSDCIYKKDVIYDRILYSFIDKYEYSKTQEYKKDEYTIYKIDNGILVNGCKIVQNLPLEIQTFGVKLKNGKLEYYTNGNNLPKEIKDWCVENIKTNGLHFINYMMIDNEVECKILNLDFKTKEELRYYFKIGIRYKQNTRSIEKREF